MDDELVGKVKALSKTHNMTQIAKKLGVGYKTIYYLCKRHEIRCVNPQDGRSIREIETIVTYSKEHGRKAACNKFGITLHALNRAYINFKKIKKESVNDHERLINLRTYALKYAVGRRQERIAEDFAQWVVVQELTGRSISLEYHFIDYMRNTHGRMNMNGNGPSHKVAETYGLNIDDVPIEAESVTGVRDLAMCVHSIKEISEKDKAILLMNIVYGLKQKEIALIFNTNPALISIRIKELINYLRTALLSESA